MKNVARLLVCVATIVTAALGCGDDAAVVDTLTLIERLEGLPGCVIQEVAPPEGAHFTRAFEISITQPVDHEFPEGPTFTQRVFLSHVYEGAPMVLVNWGYDVITNRSLELAEILGANQLYVAHRFGGDNVPDPVMWEYNTVEQSAGDHHLITELFKSIYTGPWVNYGISKGGKAAAFHRRFYPDDVLATVCVVAPFFNSTHDLRVDDFLTNTVGTQECRDKIRELQLLTLSRRDSLLPYYEEYIQSTGDTYTRVGGVEAAFEYVALEYGYVFWQYFGDVECDQIPDGSISNSDLFDYLQRISHVGWLSDASCAVFESYFYQFYTETGYYGYVTQHLDTMLQVLSSDPLFLFMLPQGVSVVFQSDVVRSARQWLADEGMNIIYVHGEFDPCTAAAMVPSATTNSISIIQPGATHLMNIRDMDQRQVVYDSLSAWLGVPVNAGN